MYYLFVVVGSALFFLGVLLIVKRPFFLFCKHSVKQLDIILDRETNDDEKQSNLVRNLKPLLTNFIVLIFLLILLAFIGGIPPYLYLLYGSKEIQNVDISSFYFILSLTLGSLILFIPIKKTSDYSYWSKLLHTIFLSNPNIAKLLFRIEKKYFLKNRNSESDKFIIVTGLARAGTTALTNLLFETNLFHSLSYANMPFLLAPNLWRKVYNPKSKNLKERAHGDKVLFGLDTIEALDEFFFKVFLNEKYISESSLQIHQLDEVSYKSYLEYQHLIRTPDKNTLYLSKNNNFILRYQSFRTYNKVFKCIVIFRDPIDHALSLLNQHNNFCEQQIKDPFVLDYMNWLGHHEFGLNNKVFNFNQSDTWEKYEKSTINYWLAVWINYYQYLLSFCSDEHLLLIEYSDLLYHPKKLQLILGKELNLSILPEEKEPFIKTKGHQKSINVDEELDHAAKNIFSQLIKFKLQVDT